MRRRGASGSRRTRAPRWCTICRAGRRAQPAACGPSACGRSPGSRRCWRRRTRRRPRSPKTARSPRSPRPCARPSSSATCRAPPTGTREIQLSIGATAAQAGMSVLAAEAFRRAVTLDPRRALLSAEAPPSAVELYARVARQVAVSALGDFEVHVAAPRAASFSTTWRRGSPGPRARAGRAPPAARRRTGVPLVRFIHRRARGRAAGAAHPAGAGSAGRDRRRARAGRTRRRLPAVVAAAASLERAGAVLAPVLVVGRSGRTGRALLVRCEAAGCARPCASRAARGPRRARLGRSTRHGWRMAVAG